MNRFVAAMAKITDIETAELSAVIEPMAQVLGIGKLDISIFEHTKFGEVGDEKKGTLYDSGSSDENIKIPLKSILSSGDAIVYTFYESRGLRRWDSDDYERICSFKTSLQVLIDRLAAIKTVDHLKYNDLQLDMPNLNFFLTFCARPAIRSKLSHFCCAHFNLKHFTLINEIVGRDKGTKIMKRYINEVRKILTSENEFVFRIGGDNFCAFLLKPHLSDFLACMSGVNIPTDALNVGEVTVSASVGIYMIPKGRVLPTEIVDRAAVASKAAKNDRLTSITYFDEQMQGNESDALKVQAMFPEAIVNEEFHVYYQPKVRLSDYELAGAEALCRWIHDGKMLMPNKFIPIFERKGLITQFDFFIIEHVCKDIRRWIDEGRKTVPISVNLSRCHFDDKLLFEHIMEIVDKYDIPHELLEIELTETTTDVNFLDLKNIVIQLNGEGITTTVDDFGIGYSSLNLIRELPWNIIKLDKSLLSNLETNPNSKLMLRHIINMARELGIDCIAEGVETLEHIKVLKELRCYMAQGFYFDRPLPSDVFEDRLDRKNLDPWRIKNV